jgi:hypothetical protein
MFDFIERLINSDQFGRSLQSPFEAYYNAKRGDILSIEDLLKIRKLEAQYVTSDIIELTKVPAYVASQKALENSFNTPTNPTTFLDKTSLPSSISLEEEQIPIEMIGKMSL